MKNKKVLIVVTGFVLVLTFLAGSAWYEKNESQKLNDLANENQNLLIRDHSLTMGPDDAKVVLVEFLDPECEACRAFHPFVKQLMADYSGKIKLVVRYAPFHGSSKYVVRVLEAARLQGKYWETLDILFQYQPRWGSHHNPQVKLIWDYLPQANIDIEQIKQDMNLPQITKILEQDIKDGANLGVRQTPTFFINGKPLVRFGYEPLRAAIVSELKR